MLDTAPEVQASHPRQTITGDKSYYGREFEHDLTDRDLKLLCRARAGESERAGVHLFTRNGSGRTPRGVRPVCGAHRVRPPASQLPRPPGGGEGGPQLRADARPDPPVRPDPAGVRARPAPGDPGADAGDRLHGRRADPGRQRPRRPRGAPRQRVRRAGPRACRPRRSSRRTGCSDCRLPRQGARASRLAAVLRGASCAAMCSVCRVRPVSPEARTFPRGWSRGRW